MRSWQVQDAKARFSELVETTLRDGPQVVTRRGLASVVVVPFDRWQEMERRPKRTLKDLLLTPEARFDDLVPGRRKPKRRPPVDLA